MISVLILTRNEELNLPRCLESVGWSDDILVVDSFSTDRTVEIAQAAGGRVLQHPFKNFADQRNFGLAQGNLKHEWVLHLDADEVVSEALKAEIIKLVRSEDAARDAYRVASRMMFEGRWLKHAGLYPSYQVRLGRKAKLAFVQVGHGQRENVMPEKLGTLLEPLVHYSFGKGLHDWVEKHNRYSTDEALLLLASNQEPLDWLGGVSTGDPTRRRRSLKRLFLRLPGRPALRFFYMYFVRLGFLDGMAGYHYCWLLAFYELLILLKEKELRQQKQTSGDHGAPNRNWV